MENQNTRNTMMSGQYMRTPGTAAAGTTAQSGMQAMTGTTGATMANMNAGMTAAAGQTMAAGTTGAAMADMNAGMTAAAGQTTTGGTTMTTTATTTAAMSNCTGDDKDGFGLLPACAPLANPYVPFQMTNSKQYLPSKGVMRGTLFPGLDLPFHAMVNDGELWGTPLAELMALDFAIKELQLYLDTHPNDQEVLDLLVSYIAMQNEGSARYVSQYGPISIRDVQAAQGYTWIKDPWPWEYVKGAEV